MLFSVEALFESSVFAVRQRFAVKNRHQPDQLSVFWGNCLTPLKDSFFSSGGPNLDRSLIERCERGFGRRWIEQTAAPRALRHRDSCEMEKTRGKVKLRRHRSYGGRQ